MFSGCARLSKNFIYDKQTKFSFLVPLSWTADYLVAMIYIIIIFTHTEVDIVSIDTRSRWLKISGTICGRNSALLFMGEKKQYSVKLVVGFISLQLFLSLTHILMTIQKCL